MTSHQDLLRRIVGERRRLVTVLGVVLAVNVLVLIGAVYPLSQRVANIEERNRAAAVELQAASQEHDIAQGTLTGKERAATELERFYADVLPMNFAAARGLTYVRLDELAREAALVSERRTYAPVEERNSSLTRLESELVLRGNYGAMRRFIYEMESAPEFVVIDDLTVTQGANDAGVLVVTLKLSTFFRSGA